MKQTQTRLAETLEAYRKSLDGIIEAMGHLIGQRDHYTADHQGRVARLAVAIAEKLGLGSERTTGVRLAAEIHDVGKIAVPAEILTKPSRLSDLEYQIIQTHSEVGHDVLKNIEFPWPIATIVKQHHEKIDGSGYPDGLCGENTLLEAKIICVADVVESMASHRPYRPALGIDPALIEIQKNRGILYDCQVVDACVALFRGKQPFSID